MTLVITAASKLGITVIADRRFVRTEYTRESPSGISTTRDGRKVFYSSAANIVLAVWGEIRVQRSERQESPLDSIVESISKSLTSDSEIHSVAVLVKEFLDREYSRDGHSLDRRGVHISGFSDNKPVIYNVHSGHPLTGTQDSFEITCDSDRFVDAIANDNCGVVLNGLNDAWLDQRRPGAMPSFYFDSLSLVQQTGQVYEYLDLVASILREQLGRKFSERVSYELDVVALTDIGRDGNVPDQLLLRDRPGAASIASGNVGVTYTGSIFPVSLSTSTYTISFVESRPKSVLAEIYSHDEEKKRR